MPHLRDTNGAEQQLLQALAHTTAVERGTDDTTECPGRWELRRLYKGKFSNPERRRDLIAHLAHCNHCLNTMKLIRRRRTLKQRILLVASALVLAGAVFAWESQHRAIESGRLETISLDLRAASLRGPKSPDAHVIKTSGKAIALRIILPPGSEGNYDVRILQANKDTPLLSTSGSTRIADHDVVLELPVHLPALGPGSYSLLLRRDHGEWAEYVLTLE